MARSPLVIDIPPRPRDSTSIPVSTTFFGEGWKENAALTCKVCGTPSQREVEGQQRCGCKRCCYITFNPGVHFNLR